MKEVTESMSTHCPDTTIRKTQCLVPDYVLSEIQSRGGSATVFGYWRARERLIQILTTEPAADLLPLGSLDCDLDSQSDEGALEQAIRFRPLTGIPEPDSIQAVRVQDGLDSRRNLIPGQAELSGKKVLLIGAGSVGSAVGVQLAQAGVGQFHVADPDHLDAANLSRHACDLRDLGRNKAICTAQLLRQRRVSADAFPEDVLGSGRLESLIAEADLVIASTDVTRVQFTVNEACVSARKSALFIGAYERASAGEVLAVLPEGPCLYCAAGFRSDLAPAPEGRGELPYQSGTEDVKGEPGLAVDIALLVSVASAYALAILDPTGSRKELLDPSRRFCLLQSASRPLEKYQDLFRGPLDLVFARVRRPAPCPVCSWTGGSVS